VYKMQKYGDKKNIFVQLIKFYETYVVYYFTNRVTPVRNTMVMADSINSFKSRVDKFGHGHCMILYMIIQCTAKKYPLKFFDIFLATARNFYMKFHTFINHS